MPAIVFKGSLQEIYDFCQQRITEAWASGQLVYPKDPAGNVMKPPLHQLKAVIVKSVAMLGSDLYIDMSNGTVQRNMERGTAHTLPNCSDQEDRYRYEVEVRNSVKFSSTTTSFVEKQATQTDTKSVTISGDLKGKLGDLGVEAGVSQRLESSLTTKLTERLTRSEAVERETETVEKVQKDVVIPPKTVFSFRRDHRVVEGTTSLRGAMFVTSTGTLTIEMFNGKNVVEVEFDMLDLLPEPDSRKMETFDEMDFELVEEIIDRKDQPDTSDYCD